MRLNSDSFDWSLKHIEIYQSHTSIFPKPFEYIAIRENWDEIKKYLTSLNLPEDWKIRDSRKIFAPKSYNGFRLCTQLDPLDELIYYSLIYELGHDIENIRLEKEKELVISYRFSPDDNGELWDPTYNYERFEDRTKEIINSNSNEFIILTDIADFFPRIYLHPLEQNLDRASDLKDHIKSLMKFIKGISQNVSYGIPVGADASFLLGELLLDSIDRRLIDENIVFCRYVDDYRIFSKDKADAFRDLNFIAEIIFNNLGLTLQQGKTRIKEITNYLKSKSNKPDPITPLSEEFVTFIENELGIEDPYEIVDVEKLSDNLRKKLDEFQFDTILKEQLTTESSNLNLIKFLINRLSQINNKSAIKEIIANFEVFYPIINTVITYFSNLQNLDTSLRVEIGEKLLDLLENSFIGQSSYNRLWILSLFTKSSEWGGSERLVEIFNKFDDDFTRRELILAMGAVGKEYWFSAEKRGFPSRYTSWQRRAFLMAFSCVNEDAKYHWYRSMEKNTDLDLLDLSIIKWMKN